MDRNPKFGGADEWVMPEYKLQAPSTTVCGIAGIIFGRSNERN
jgi:hypothetical protein